MAQHNMKSTFRRHWMNDPPTKIQADQVFTNCSTQIITQKTELNNSDKVYTVYSIAYIIQCRNGIPIRPPYYSLVYFNCTLISLIIYVTPTRRTLCRPDDGFVGRNMSLASY
jgi:hypothetical protein